MAVLLEKTFEFSEERRSAKCSTHLCQATRFAAEILDHWRFTSRCVCQGGQVERLLGAHRLLPDGELRVDETLEREADLFTDLAHRQFVEKHTAEKQHSL